MQCGYQLGSTATINQYISKGSVGPVTAHTIHVVASVDVNPSSGYSRNRHAGSKEAGQRPQSMGPKDGRRWSCQGLRVSTVCEDVAEL